MELKYFDWAKHQAVMRPNKVAIKDYYSGEELTYLELEKRALKIATYFQRKKIGINDRVALLSRNNSVFFELQFACAKKGVILVPLNWRLTAPELSFILKDCDPKLLVFDSPFKGAVSSLNNSSTNMKLLEFDSSNFNNEFSSVWESLDDDRNGTKVKCTKIQENGFFS